MLNDCHINCQHTFVLTSLVSKTNHGPQNNKLYFSIHSLCYILALLENSTEIRKVEVFFVTTSDNNLF